MARKSESPEWRKAIGFFGTYDSNDPEAVVRLYAQDAILIGTVSLVLPVGTEAI
jgi:hypothetical protein